jgi:Raf kinase inhibitor-like YbhB/YbcL family protein
VKQLIFFLIIVLFGCQNGRETKPVLPGTKILKLTITSAAFEQGGMIPKKYTGDAENISPPLAWSEIPGQAKSLALIVDDPDAPSGDWVHWVVYNMPATMKEMPEDIGPDERVPGIGIQGKNDFGKIGWGGPYPPSGTHRYFFRLYALDVVLDDLPGLTKKQLLAAIQGHILAQGELMGQYKR